MYINNVINIAKRDLLNLLANNGVIIVMLVFFILVIITTINILDQSSAGMITDNDFIYLLLGSLTYILTVYGSIIAVLLGFLFMSLDRISHAINTLLVKPVYRDTIINGKLLGSILLIFGIFLLTTLFYISMLFLMFGSRFESVFFIFLGRVPVILLLSLIVTLTFLCMSMLISSLLDGKSVALLVNILLFVILYTTPTMGIGGNISVLFGNYRSQVLYVFASMSPNFNLDRLAYNGLFDPTISVVGVLSSCRVELSILLIGLLVLLVLNYIVSLRRDIA
jgi:ABC-2 type transport system permease protein